MARPAIAAWETLFRAEVRMLRVLISEFPDDGITFNEYDVVFTTAREPGHQIRMRELTRNVLLSQSSVSRLVDRLVSRGLLVKHEDPQDRRGAVVQLTDVGMDAFRRVAEVHGASIDRLMTNALDPAELKQLHRVCAKLQASIPDATPRTGRTSL